MQYWKQPTRQVEDIQHELYSREAHGIYASEMERYLKDTVFERLSSLQPGTTWPIILTRAGR